MTFNIPGYQRGNHHPEGNMFAIIAAVLFGLALIFDLTKAGIGTIGTNTLVIAGLLCIALHLAGVLSAVRRRRR
jgi:hypothetical protein